MGEFTMYVTRRSFGSLALSGALGGALAGVLAPSVPAVAKAPFAGKQTAGLYRLKVGGFEVTVVSDGWGPLETKLLTGDPGTTAKALEASFLPTDKIPLSVNTWLVNTGDKLILVDTGAANVLAPTMGRLVTNLATAGVEPAAIDMVILTHMHPDHVAGLLTVDKKIAFPNATVHVNEAEYAFWTSPELYAKAPDEAKPFYDIARNSMQPYKDAGKVELFKDGAVFAPGITANAATGHTAGHTMIRLSSGSGALLLTGDIVHSAALQFANPDVAIAYDTNQTEAIATRKRVLDLVAAERVMIAGAHLPFPGLGHVAKAATGYAYVPVEWGADL
jgi:glyoxylase-like metal-dependent hydrolase (beta-lactamase superfamily II)